MDVLLLCLLFWCFELIWFVDLSVRVDATLTWSFLKTWCWTESGIKSRNIFLVSQLSMTTSTRPRFILKSESWISLRHWISEWYWLFNKHLDKHLHAILCVKLLFYMKLVDCCIRNDRAKALDILMKDLKVFSQDNEELYREMTQLLTLDNFRYMFHTNS